MWIQWYFHTTRERFADGIRVLLNTRTNIHPHEHVDVHVLYQCLRDVMQYNYPCWLGAKTLGFLTHVYATRLAV